MMTHRSFDVHPPARASCTVVTDSSACLGRRATELGIRVLPIDLYIGGVEVSGDDERTAELVDEALERGDPVKSSAPSVSAYLSAVEEAPTDDVVVLTPAQEFTTMHANARLAATLTDKRVRVLDTRTAAGPQGLIAMHTARMALAGRPPDAVEASVREDASRAELVAALARPDVLRASGRIGAGAVTFAEHLGIRPVFRLHDGRVERLGVPRGEERAIRRICTEAASLGFRSDCDAMVLHVGCPELALRLRRALASDAPITVFSPAIAAHTGRELVGLAWLRPRTGATGAAHAS